jgi:hypothetical protein
MMNNMESFDCHGKNNGAEIAHFGMCGLENDKYSILILAHEERNKTSREYGGG